GTGGNAFNVKSTSGNTLTTVNTGFGSPAKTLNVGSLAPAVGGNVNGIAGMLVINGQGTNDTVNVDDTGDPPPNEGLLTNNRRTGLGMAADDPAKGITYGGVETLNINLGGGDDQFQIRSVGNVTNVNAGAGADAIRVGSAFVYGSRGSVAAGTVNDIV